MKVFLLLSVAVIAMSLAEPEIKGLRVPLESGSVYQIFNRVDNGVLTVDVRPTDNSVPVFSRTYNSTAGQKWRLRKAVIGNSFKLIPTSNENSVLDLDKNTLSIWRRISAVGNQRFWNLNNMGEGQVQIQNWHNSELCLTSFGLDKEISVAECENSPAQQWQFISI